MSETISWKILPKNEWDRLEQFFAQNLPEDAIVPDPVLSEVLVTEDDEGNILAIFQCSLQLVLGPSALATNIDPELSDAVYASGVEAMRGVCLDLGADNVVLMSIHAEDKTELMEAVGFIPADVHLYVGNV